MLNDKIEENYFYNENIYKLFEPYINRVIKEINNIEYNTSIDVLEKERNYVIKELMKDSYIKKDFISGYNDRGEFNTFSITVLTGPRGSKDSLTFQVEQKEDMNFKVKNFAFYLKVSNDNPENSHLFMEYKVEKDYSLVIIHDLKNNLKILLKDKEQEPLKFFLLLNANNTKINENSYPLENMIIKRKDEKSTYNNIFKLENKHFKFNFDFFTKEYNEIFSLLHHYQLDDYSFISINLDSFKPRRLYYEEKKQLTKKNKRA